MRAARLSLVAGLAALCCLSGCAPDRTVVSSTPSAFDHVPAGTTAVSWIRPKALLASTAGTTCLRAVFSAADQRELEARYRLLASDVDLLLRVELPEGNVTLVQGRFDADAVVRALGARMVGTRLVTTDRPRVRRRGYVGEVVREAVALASGLVAFGDAEAGGIDAVLARAGGRRAGAFEGAEARAVLTSLEAGLVGAVAPQRLASLDTGGLGVLLARHRAIGVAVEAHGDGHLALALAMRGELPAGADGNLRTWAREVASSEVGELVGMPAAMSTLTVRVDRGGAVLRILLEARELSEGLRAMFLADMPELLGH